MAAQGNNKGFMPRYCDGCRAVTALLYCRAEATFFCGSCDCAAAGHERVWICEVCEQEPSVVTCKADAASLCSLCDADIHSTNPLAHRHERLPVTPLPDSLSVAAACSSAPFSAAPDASEDDDAEAWLIQNPSSNVLMAEFLCSESDLFDFGASSSQNNLENSTRRFALSDSTVPTQLKGNLRLSDNSNRLFENSFDIDFSQSDMLQNNELSFDDQQMLSSLAYSAQHSESSSENGVVPDGNANLMPEVSFTFSKAISNVGNVADEGSSVGTGVPARATDREARVLRYREKRKNRKFQKTIRYASRKAYAETRPRIKGRFTKRKETNETLEEIKQIYEFGSGSVGFLLESSRYGVVPSFS